MLDCKKAFTLAEILITLVLIGVVSSLTIPSLINNIGDQQNKIAWKKSFADLSQVTMLIMADNGGSIKGLCNNNECIRNLYLLYMRYTKLCDTGRTLNNCWYDKNELKALNGNKYIDSGAYFDEGSSAILNNGNLLYFLRLSSTCSYTDWGSQDCGLIYIDVNGFSKPNTVGKDVFVLHLTENSIKPLGADTAGWSKNCIPSGVGQGCSALYLYQ